jgi:tRNA U34 5-carboxymethylaminomethyl modifying GTPase MnmE/TrmE
MLVVHMSPVTARDWTAGEVAARWVKLYLAQTAGLREKKTKRIKLWALG